MTKYSTIGTLMILLTICLGMLSTAQAADNGAAQSQDDATVTLNLKDADIRTLIETVADATGKNFVIDPRVKAKVTVVSSRPMNENDLYDVFLSVLQVHGYAAVPVGEVTKIVPDVQAKQGPVAVTGKEHPGKGDELVTRVIPVKHVPAAQMVPILRPLVPQQGHLAAYSSSNSLVVSDRADNIKRLAKIVHRMDRPQSKDIEVVPLEHASATEVVRTINSLNQQQAGGQPQPGANKPVLVPDERTNSILVSGDSAAKLRIRGLIAHLDTPTEGGGNTEVIFLNYAKAEDLVPILLGVSEQQSSSQANTNGGGAAQAGGQSGDGATGGSVGEGKEGIDIQADESNNALIVTAPPKRIQSIKHIVNQLDVRRAQVLVEAIIAEVSQNLSKDLGLQFAVLPNGDTNGPVAINNIPGSGVSLPQLLQNPASFGAGLFVGAADLRDDRTNFALLLRALEGDSATNILSTPTLTTLDNEEAEIVVGQNVPFVTGSFSNTGAGASTGTGQVNPFQTIERQDVGLTLNITPQINEGDSVKLDLELESSSIASTTTQGVSDIITNKREVKNSVLVDNGHVLVLGGLIEDTENNNIQKTPVLGDIPLLGALFRNKSSSKDKQNLMVFIHPLILRDQRTASAATSAKYDFLRARQLEANVHAQGLFNDEPNDFPDLDGLITQLPSVGRATGPAEGLITQDPRE